MEYARAGGPGQIGRSGVGMVSNEVTEFTVTRVFARAQKQESPETHDRPGRLPAAGF